MGGVVVVAGLAARRNKTLSNVSTATTSTSSTNAAAPASYDSSGTDVYNAFEGLLQQVDQLAGQTPVPSATSGVTSSNPQSLGVWAHYRDNGTGGAYYNLFDNGDGTFSSQIVSAGQATVEGLSAKGKLNDAQFATFDHPLPTSA
ncbi:MAG TPA: hypothetical protein VGC04_11250 [Cellulomonas sp.]